MTGRGSGGPRKQSVPCDSARRTGTHISKMSRQHSSGRATVCQVSPTAARTLNIGTRNVCFRKGRRGGGGSWKDRASRPPDSPGKVTVGQALLARCGQSLPSARRRTEAPFTPSQGRRPKDYAVRGRFCKAGKSKEMLAFVVTGGFDYENYNKIASRLQNSFQTEKKKREKSM